MTHVSHENWVFLFALLGFAALVAPVLIRSAIRENRWRQAGRELDAQFDALHRHREEFVDPLVVHATGDSEDPEDRELAKFLIEQHLVKWRLLMKRRAFGP